ncbi:MAG TPA: LLM class flavin-dependent oxidoreductase [Candidatus Limnocylindrales bacterium]|nr:LLM class flavin-dependent oxidoreductase [Candidatus Limnocylindrales bacterium]
MRFGAAFWINRTDWPTLVTASLAAEQAGFDTIWLDDHLLADEGDWRDDKLEGWASLAGLAQVVRRPRLGLLVAANTFRNPGLTAKLATTLDHLTDGRFLLGLGGGWLEREHDAFGLDFGSGFGERLDRLEESVGLIQRLLAGETVTHAGRFYELREAICRPLPIQRPLPILIGGSGRTKTLRTTAIHAAMWNGYGAPHRIVEAADDLRARCEEVGRPFDEIERTVTMDVVIRNTAEAARRAYTAIQDRHGLHGLVDRRGDPEDVNAAGPPAAVVDYLRDFAAMGIAEAMWVFRTPYDLETIGHLPEVRAALDG